MEIYNSNTHQVDLEKNKTDSSISSLKFFLIFVGLALSVFLAALDVTIVSTALPNIASQLNAMGQISWVPTSYLLTSTVLQPMYGKASDIFGRKYTLLFAITLFLIGSIGCGLSPSISWLISFRALSGVGGGGLISLAVIIIADLVSLRKRAKYMGIIGSVFGLSSIIGPLLGGLIVDHFSWKWLFYINLPVGSFAILIICFCLPNLQTQKTTFKEKIHKIDLAGSLILISSTVCFLLALSWAGQEYPWSSPIIISLLIVGIVLMIIFIIVEYKFIKDPIISSKLFNRNTTLSLLSSFFLGLVMYDVLYYLPLFFQVVRLNSATISGLHLMPFLLAHVFFSIGSGLLASYSGYYLPSVWLGGTFASVAVGLLSMLKIMPNYGFEIPLSIMLGAGIGLGLQNLILSAQASSNAKDMAAITSLVSFMRQIGGVFGLAIQGTIINNQVQKQLALELQEIVSFEDLNVLVANIKNLPSDVILAIQNSYVFGFRFMFLSLIPFALMWLIFSLFIKHKPLGTKKELVLE